MATRERVSPAANVPVGAQAWSVLKVSTLAFMVCFVVWMTGSLVRVPLACGGTGPYPTYVDHDGQILA